MIYFAQNIQILHSEHIKMATNMVKYLQNLGHDRHHQGIKFSIEISNSSSDKKLSSCSKGLLFSSS